MRSTHSQQLERWVGSEQIEAMSQRMRTWYGPPIALGGVPGEVYVCGDGDFIGHVDGGQEACVIQRARDLSRRLYRRAAIATDRRRRACLNGGFASLADLISEAAGGKRQEIFFNSGNGGLINTSTNTVRSLWGLLTVPAAGAAGSAAAAGRAPTSATAGAIGPQIDAASGDQLHYVGGSITLGNVNAMSVLIYDRLFDVAKTMNNTSTEAVSGTPSRYQNLTPGSANSCQGNFLFVEVNGTNLAATAHNWTVCTYKDQENNSSTLPSLAGVSGQTTWNLDHPSGSQNWFAPLASGDTGISALTQMQCSALVATGAVSFVIGHPIAWMIGALQGITCDIGGISTALNLARVFDGAALSGLFMTNTTSSTTLDGHITLVSG